MSDDLTDADPFEGEPDLISDPMVRKATFHIHKLANQRNEKFEDIRDKCRKLFKYTNLAKVTVEDGHKIINKLVELTGGEEEQPQPTVPQLPTKPDEPKREIKKQPVDKEETKTEEDVVTTTMRESIRAAVDITLKELVEKDVPVMGLGGFVLDVGKVLFEAKMKASVEK